MAEYGYKAGAKPPVIGIRADVAPSIRYGHILRAKAPVLGLRHDVDPSQRNGQILRAKPLVSGLRQDVAPSVRYATIAPKQRTLRLGSRNKYINLAGAPSNVWFTPEFTITVLDSTHLQLDFASPLKRNNALITTGNYVIDPPLEVKSVTAEESETPAQLILEVSEMLDGQNYTLEIQGVEAL